MHLHCPSSHPKEYMDEPLEGEEPADNAEVWKTEDGVAKCRVARYITEQEEECTESPEKSHRCTYRI